METVYTEEVAKAICDRLSTSTDGLKTICKDDGMPDARTVTRWLIAKPEFFEMYNNAKMRQMDLLAEECLEIAKGADVGDWQVAKLHIETVKWLTSKLAPKRYGDKITHSGDAESPIVISPSSEALVAYLLSTGLKDAEILRLVEGQTIEHVPSKDKT